MSKSSKFVARKQYANMMGIMFLPPGTGFTHSTVSFKLI
jgi:hypothetical protein